MELDEENEEMANSINSEKNSIKEKEDFMNIFGKIGNFELSAKENILYNNIYSETQRMDSYLMKSINEFHQIFHCNLLNFEEALNYLEKIAIPNKFVCAGVIETIPGWRCVECSKYENAIYCNDCYKKSKHLHKGHKVYFLPSSGGMCDCGDPDSLYIFCPDHSGPYVNQSQINEYISKVFPNDILNKLILFFDELFLNFSKYFILTEKCDLFFNEMLIEKFKNINEENQELINEKDDIIFLKKNFCVVFQNLIHFLRLISENNLAILHLIAKYLLKNHLENQKLEEDYITTHRCISITEDNINIMFEDGQKHICQCPFLRLLMSNWREEIKSKDNENEEFILSFPRDLSLRNNFCIIFFFLYKALYLNNNADIIYNRHQFFLEDTTELIAKKSILIEENYQIFYEYLKNHIESSKIKDENGSLILEKIRLIKWRTQQLENDTKYYSKPKVRKLMTEKTSIIKRIIDSFCLIHNELEFKSIFPHPQFQSKKENSTLIEIEIALSGILEEINMFIDWEKIDKVKEIFAYIINKIINQEKEGIKQLKDDEYRFQLSLYRCFGLLINFFCFNYAIRNKCPLINVIEFATTNFFESTKKNDVELLVVKILNDYFRLF